jgi:hypothetical protein
VREVSLYWLAYKITGSACALGILGFCEGGAAPLAGRRRRRDRRPLRPLAIGAARSRAGVGTYEPVSLYSIGFNFARIVGPYCSVFAFAQPRQRRATAIMDQGMRSLGSMVMGAFPHGLALTSVISITLTALTFWRLLGRVTKA